MRWMTVFAFILVLTSVESLAGGDARNITIKEGDVTYLMSLMSANTNDKTTFDDHLVKVSFQSQNARGLVMTIINQTDEQLTIDWRSLDCRLSAPSDTSQDVTSIYPFIFRFLSSVSVTERGLRGGMEEVKDKMNIPPKKAETVAITSCDTTLLLSGKYKQQLLPNDSNAARKLQGKLFRISIPMVVDGNPKNYDFDFKVEAIE